MKLDIEDLLSDFPSYGVKEILWLSAMLTPGLARKGDVEVFGVHHWGRIYNCHNAIRIMTPPTEPNISVL